MTVSTNFVFPSDKPLAGIDRQLPPGRLFFFIQAPVQNTAVGLINGNEACVIHMRAVDDLLRIISTWNQFVSLSAFVYLLSCWDKGGN